MRSRPPAHAVSVDLEVPFHDVDALRVVWHGHYLKYLEIARTALMRRRGLDVADVVALGYRQMVIETRCRHIFPLHYGDRFRVLVWVTESVHRVGFTFEIWNVSHDRRAARASTTLVTTDADGRLLLETPDVLRRLLEATP